MFLLDFFLFLNCIFFINDRLMSLQSVYIKWNLFKNNIHFYIACKNFIVGILITWDKY